ncbi:hypothetical protein JCM6882_004234 [Rhodosporidiobolus microsporus]
MTPDKSNNPRSSFVSKLHELLSAEQHPEYLHWLDNSTFAITSIDAHARIALAPQWDFRSLSSFIRQLSYYSFKRLSDRRRSAERRASAAWIVFTHPSGNFVRDDYGKTVNIPRKLRARKPTSKRKNSSASVTSNGDGYDRSPTPPDALQFEMYSGDEHKPTEVHLGLQSYQLAPWNAIDQGRTIRSPHRPLSNLPPDHLQLAPHASVREQPHVYDTAASGYPSPLSAPASSSFFPASSYYPPHAQVQPIPEQSSYYYAASSSAPGVGSPFSTFANNELPPLRTVTSGLVAPPSPPPEPHYVHHAHYDQPHPHASDEERTPSPMPSYAQIPAPQPIALPSVAQLDPHHFYPPSPPKHHNAYFASSHPHATPHHPVQLSTTAYGSPASHHTHEAAKSAFYHLSGQSGVDYPTSSPMTAATHA